MQTQNGRWLSVGTNVVLNIFQEHQVFPVNFCSHMAELLLNPSIMDEHPTLPTPSAEPYVLFDVSLQCEMNVRGETTSCQDLHIPQIRRILPSVSPWPTSLRETPRRGFNRAPHHSADCGRCYVDWTLYHRCLCELTITAPQSFYTAELLHRWVPGRPEKRIQGHCQFHFGKWGLNSVISML